MKKKLLVLVALVLTVCSISFVATTAAENKASKPELNIAYCNLSFRDSVCVKYAVKSDVSNAKILIWTNPQSSYTYGSHDDEIEQYYTEDIGGTSHMVFDYTKLVAKQMTDVIYARAYAQVDGEEYYSEINKYSILQYAYNKLGKTGTASTDVELREMLTEMLEYGAAAQKYLNDYKVDRLATADWYQVKLTGGLLEDGCKHGLYLEGDQVTMIAPKTNEDGTPFSYWADSNGNSVSNDATYTLTVGNKNEEYTPVYAQTEKLNQFYYDCSDNNSSLFLTNTTREILLRDDDVHPTNKVAYFILADFNRTERLYLRIPNLKITSGMSDAKLDMTFYRIETDPEFSFRVSYSIDGGISWKSVENVVLSQLNETVKGYTLNQLRVSDLEKLVSKDEVITDIKIEPFSNYTAVEGAFRICEAKVSCIATAKDLEWNKNSTCVLDETMPTWNTNATTTTITGTMDGKDSTAQSYQKSTSNEALWISKEIEINDRSKSIVLTTLVKKGTTPNALQGYYAKDSNAWFGPIKSSSKKTNKVFIADDNTEYDVYEIVVELPDEPSSIKKIQLEDDNATALNVVKASVISYYERDDAAMIQKMIDDAKAAGQNTITIPKVNPETGKAMYNIGETIWLSSDTTIILDGCQMRFKDGVVCNMFATRGAWDASDSETVMQGHKNIKILGKNGAKFDGGNSNGKTESTVGPNESMYFNSFVFFRNVDGFEVSGIEAYESRYWCFTFIYARNGSVHDIHFECHNTKPNQDGVDLRAGCHNIDIYNLTGVTGDDTVALTDVGRLDAWWVVNGIEDIDIHDVNIYNVDAGCSGGHSVIRLLAQDGRRVYNVDIKNVRDASLDGLGQSCIGLIRIGDTTYYSVKPQGLGDISNITIDGVVSNSNAAIYIKNENVTKDHVTYSNIEAKKGVKVWVLNQSKFYGTGWETTMPTGLKELSFQDFTGIESGTYKGTGTGLYAGNDLKDTVVQGKITFATSGNNYFMLGGKESWKGIGLQVYRDSSGRDILKLYDAKGNADDKMFNDIFFDSTTDKVNFIGKEIELKITIQYVDADADKNVDDIKLGIWIGDVLLRDQYSILYDYVDSDHSMGNYLTIWPDGNAQAAGGVVVGQPIQ